MAVKLKNIVVFAGLLVVSSIIHLALSWRFTPRIDAAPQTTVVEAPGVRLDLSVATDDEPPQAALVFSEPMALEAPSVIIQGDALRPPPPQVDLALQAAAGGAAVQYGYNAVELEMPAVGGDGLAGFGEGVGEGEGLSTHQFSAYIQSLRESGLDVMFVVDASGSMGWVLAEVDARIVDIVDAVRSLVPVARFGLVAYRDFDDPGFITRLQPLTFSSAKLNRFLASLNAAGGGSWHEAISAGIGRAVDDAGWRAGSRKVIILIGDAPPHPENEDNILDMAAAMVEQGGQISTLDVSHDSNPALLEATLGRKVSRSLYRDRPMLQFQAIADAGGGVAATMDGDVQITRQLLNLIMGGQFSREISLLMDGI